MSARRREARLGLAVGDMGTLGVNKKVEQLKEEER